MSILLVEVVPQGIVFGADRNLTLSDPNSNFRGYLQRPKVLRWPKNKALVGYVGAATIGDRPAEEWLYDFIGDNLNFKSFGDLAESLRSQIERDRRSEEAKYKIQTPELLIVHLGGFEEKEGIIVPTVWVIRNAHDVTGMDDVRQEFLAISAFWDLFSKVEPRLIKKLLAECADSYSPFWFHQGMDLKTFNMLDGFLRSAFRMLCEHHPGRHSVPQTIFDWECQVQMSILTYGAYFQSYRGPDEQYVGGGVDTVSIEWPRE